MHPHLKKSGTGIIKIIAKNDDGTIRNQLDKSFAKGNVNFRGYEKDRDCGNAKSMWLIAMLWISLVKIFCTLAPTQVVEE